MEAFTGTVLAICFLVIAATVTAAIVTACTLFIVRVYYDIQYEKLNGNKKDLI